MLKRKTISAWFFSVWLNYFQSKYKNIKTKLSLLLSYQTILCWEKRSLLHIVDFKIKRKTTSSYHFIHEIHSNTQF